MKKMILILIGILMLTFATFADVELTDEEKEWLEEHPVIRYAGDPSWPPIDFLKNQQQGLGIDYLEYIKDVLGISIEYVSLDSWNDIIFALENGEVDVALGSYHASREATMVFSDKMLEIPYIFISRHDYSTAIDLKTLNVMTIATVEGWVLNDVLKESHPGLITHAYPTVADALKAVSFGEEDLMIHELASASYEIESHKITNLKFQKEYPRTVDVRFLIRKDYDMFKGIVNKVLDDMTSTQKKTIYNQWISLKIQPFYEDPIYIVIFTIILISGIMALLGLTFLKKQIQIKTQELKNELNHKNEIQNQLEEAMAQQKEMQQEMIRQERLASLGSMVASISHEVNNPLGVCLTTASAFKRKLEKLNDAYEQDNLKKQQFLDFIETGNEATQLIESNLQRAIQTISGFKNMAINQMHGGKELINVCSFLNFIKDNLKYELKKKHVNLEILCSDHVMILGDVGALTQIMTNLILNSLVHGFVDGGEPFHIQIKSGILDKVLVMEYKDNGVGIPEEHMDKIFKLFFTTKREEGGSGIGLHIVQNLLKEQFEGTIKCDYYENTGVHFVINIPLRNH